MKSLEINIPLYNTKMLIMCGNKIELDEAILAYTSDITKGIHKSHATVTPLIEYPGWIFVLFNNETEITRGIIAHESLHVLYHLYCRIGESMDGNEKDAYLLQWVFEQIEDLIFEK